MVDAKLEDKLSPQAADKAYMTLALMKEKYINELIANKAKKESA